MAKDLKLNDTIGNLLQRIYERSRLGLNAHRDMHTQSLMSIVSDRHTNTLIHTQRDKYVKVDALSFPIKSDAK